MQKFWMVIGEHDNATSERYETYIEAEKEATRLCQTLGQPCYILQAINLFKHQESPVIRVEL